MYNYKTVYQTVKKVFNRLLDWNSRQVFKTEPFQKRAVDLKQMLSVTDLIQNQKLLCLFVLLFWWFNNINRKVSVSISSTENLNP